MTTLRREEIRPPQSALILIALKATDDSFKILGRLRSALANSGKRNKAEPEEGERGGLGDGLAVPGIKCHAGGNGSSIEYWAHAE